MKKHFKLGIIGCGSMAQSILKGVVLSDFLSEKKIAVSDISEDKLDAIENLGVFATLENKFVAENCEFLILAVNPENFKDAVKSLGGYKPEKIISIIQGVTKNEIKNEFGADGLKVARCTLNLPCAVGSGIIGIDMSDYNGSVADTEFISKTFDCVGTVLSIDESKINAATALGVGGPAAAFMFIDSLIDAGVKQGLTRDEANILAIQSVIGAVDMLDTENSSLSELTVKACKGNSAIEAVKVFENGNFRGVVSDGIEACAKRLKGASDK